MWNKVSSLLGLKETEQKKDRSLELATGALLVQVSVVDNQFDPSEKQALIGALQSHFALSQSEAEYLFEEALKAQDDANCLYKFTRMITAELDQDGRQQIVKLLWQVAFADQHIDNMELNAVAKIAGLLGVSPEDRIRLKYEVEAEA